MSGRQSGYGRDDMQGDQFGREVPSDFAGCFQDFEGRVAEIDGAQNFSDRKHRMLLILIGFVFRTGHVDS